MEENKDANNDLKDHNVKTKKNKKKLCGLIVLILITILLIYFSISNYIKYRKSLETINSLEDEIVSTNLTQQNKYLSKTFSNFTVNEIQVDDYNMLEVYIVVSDSSEISKIENFYTIIDEPWFNYDYVLLHAYSNILGVFGSFTIDGRTGQMINYTAIQNN